MTELDITIDRSSPIPLYHQVASAFDKAIREGVLPPETKLENEISLAKRYNLSRPTMRQAMDQLVRDGLVVRRRGVGTQVIGPPVRRNLRLSSLYNDLQDEGAAPQTRVLSLETVTAPEPIREKLGLGDGAEVYHLRRLRLVDGRPLALMENWLPVTLAQLTREDLEADGLYNLLRRAGVDFRMAHQRVGAAVADEEQASQLKVEAGSALVVMERTALASSGAPIECGRHVYRADRYAFDITLMN
ncbi:GntR family transcriptional regulator [Nesterenkonia sphaerica]|uniref:GntR family transcriptional regulator n=1 Tax=Nesterenkonia sphaerica TaxID=1804988 RepID=A0A5R9AQ59_9MICC|nr:GntR family transcriptional regulator [Nesterenkonia sphaerica]TLP80015.1 GntR family transcriptional regulator [Nesterenkonia sphaerica]